MKKTFGRISLVWGAAILSANLWAFPANPTPYTVDNAGDSLTLRNLGDERYRYTQSLDGHIVVRDTDGVYYYADENGKASRFKAKNRQSSREKSFLQSLDENSVRKAHRQRNSSRLNFPSGREKRAPWVPTENLSSDDSLPPLLRLPSAEAHANGTNRFPVLLVSGSGSSNADSTAYWKRLNLSGYSEDSHIGSVKDYFTAQSNGLFVPAYDLYFVSVSNALSSYTDNVDGLVSEAIANLKSKYSGFDASLYDSDGDGEVDAVAVLYAGTESDANNLGGYQYSLQYTNSGRQDAGNGKKFNCFFIISQMESSTKLLPMATFVHEFSHTMGLKDHYCVYGDSCYLDYSSSTLQAPGAHGWDVMATGMYNLTNGATPPGYSAFEKEFMGWMSYKSLSASSDVTVITPLSSTDVAYKIPVNGDNDEWFILENRQQSGWDASLPYHGLLIWHIDYDKTAWNGDALNDEPSHQRVDVVEAGNLRVTGYTDGFNFAHLKDDPFPGSQNVTSFTGFNSWAGTDLGVSLYNITENGSNVCFATSSGVSVGDCTVSSSSSSNISSSSAASSSSAQSSSSSFLSSSSEALTVAEFHYSVSILRYVNYATTSVSLNDAFSSLGISGRAETLYNSGSLAYYAVEPDGSLNATSTAEAPGNWFNASGYTCSWDSDGSSSRIFSEVDLSNEVAKIGQHPNGVSIGDVYTVRQALRYGTLQANMTFAISIADSATTSIAGLQNGKNSIRAFHDRLEVSSQVPGEKTVSLYDLSGKELFRQGFASQTATFDLNGLPNSGVLVVKLSQNGKSLLVRRIAR